MNEEQLFAELAALLAISPHQVAATVGLLDDGASIPFIARYRKEVTGSLDEVQVIALRDGIARLREREARRQYISHTIAEQGKLSPELQHQIDQARTLSELEDLYMPYKPKRRTRATIARERGLEPLAQLLLAQTPHTLPLTAAAAYLDADKGVTTPEEALSGARDIIAEHVNETAAARDRIRRLFERQGRISSKLGSTADAHSPEAQKYKDYFDWAEPINRIPSHRLLAILRGANEGILRYAIEPDEDLALDTLQRLFVTHPSSPCADQVRTALRDAYKRLMQPSLETELRNSAKERADTDAIRVFADNLHGLLLAPPLGQQRVLAIDPGFRTGCKTVCLDQQGKLLHNTTIYPHDSNPMRRFEATAAIEQLCDKYQIQAIAVGNGTAGRETFQLLQRMQLPNIKIVLVNESGASVYSASEVARAEFPDHDITVRGAVSIGRRLIDPLAELVKIDAKAIGVGQYQHDVDQHQLRHQLDDVVSSCVNKVGVDVNTASPELLRYVSGMGNKLAQNVVNYRNENGEFIARSQFKKIPGLGPKAFEQSAGFLRIAHAANPLDASAVHPESYPIVAQMAKDLQCTVPQLMQQAELRQQIDLTRYVTPQVGLPTLSDILAELAKPGRDPRSDFETTTYDERVSTIDDLHEGMILAGVVTNVTNFGAFVDIGLHESGLVHISELSDRRITDPRQVVKVQQKVQVRVINVDRQRKRIQLSMKGI